MSGCFIPSTVTVIISSASLSNRFAISVDFTSYITTSIPVISARFIT